MCLRVSTNLSIQLNWIEWTIALSSKHQPKNPQKISFSYSTLHFHLSITGANLVLAYKTNVFICIIIWHNAHHINTMCTKHTHTHNTQCIWAEQWNFSLKKYYHTKNGVWLQMNEIEVRKWNKRMLHAYTPRFLG